MHSATQDRYYSLVKQAQFCSQVPAGDATAQERSQYRRAQRAASQLLSEVDRFLWSVIHQVNPALEPEEAYSIALEGFRKAVATFNFTTPFVSWLKTKVWGTLMDAHRKVLTELSRQQHIESHCISEYRESVKQPMETVETEIPPVITDLPSEQQELLTLRYEGYSWAEIGERLQATAEAVRKRFTRLRTRLLKRFNVEEEPESVKPQQIKRNLWSALKARIIIPIGRLSRPKRLRPRGIRPVQFMGIVAIFSFLAVGIADSAHGLGLHYPLNRYDGMFEIFANLLGTQVTPPLRDWISIGILLIGTVLVGGLIITSMKQPAHIYETKIETLNQRIAELEGKLALSESQVQS